MALFWRNHHYSPMDSDVYIDPKEQGKLPYDTLQLILKSYQNASYVLNRKGNIIAFNQRLVDFLHYKPKEFFTCFSKLFVEPDVQRVEKYFEKAMEGELQSFRAALKKKDGETVNIQMLEIPIMLNDENAILTVLKEGDEALEEFNITQELAKEFDHLQKLGHFGLVEFDPSKDEYYWSDYVYHLLGITSNDPKPKLTLPLFLKFIHPEDRSTFKQLYEGLVEKGESFSLTFRIIRRDGTERVIHGQAVTKEVVNGQPSKLLGIILDITEKKEAENRLMEVTNRFLSIANEIDAVIWSLDPICNKVLYCSNSVKKILGVDVDFFMKVPSYWKICFHPEDMDKLENALNLLKEGTPLIDEYRMIRPDGEVIWTKVQMIPTINEFGEMIRLDSMIIDITEAKQYELKLQQMAHYDPLTSLPNGYSLSNDFPKWIDSAHLHQDMFAVFSIGIDRIKKINNTLGHLAGDAVIKQTAERIQKIVCDYGSIYRIGGDEFIALVKIDQDIDSYIQLAQDILDYVEAPLEIDQYEVYVTTSIGISFYPTEGITSDILLQCANAALYRAKKLGKNNYQIYTKSMNIMTLKDYYIEKELRKALENHQLYMEYQPRIDVKAKQVIGAEALLRWKHPEWGNVSPADFIPLAEEDEIINQISDWVLESVCSQIRKWMDDGLQFQFISVNISPKRLLKKGFYDFLVKTTTEKKIPPNLLEIEITESSLLIMDDYVQEQIIKIRDLGVRIALDDFGTSYTSINNIKNFPIDVLKIDKSFIQNIDKDHTDRIITQSLIQMAKGLNLRVVAEGVETQVQLNYLENYQCDEIQGFIYSPSVTDQKIEQLFVKRNMTPQQSAPSIQSEQRKYFRIEFPNPLLSNITITSIQNKQIKIGKTEVAVLNIGGGGLSFVSHLRLPSNDKIVYQFETELMGEKMVLQGNIVWGKEVKSNIYQYGLKFIVSEHEREKLISLLNIVQIQLRNKRIIRGSNFIPDDPIQFIEKTFL